MGQKGARWFILTLMASSPCLLCSTSYITNHVVITDVTFLDGAATSTQETGVMLQSGKEHWTKSLDQQLCLCTWAISWKSWAKVTQLPFLFLMVYEIGNSFSFLSESCSSKHKRINYSSILRVQDAPENSFKAQIIVERQPWSQSLPTSKVMVLKSILRKLPLADLFIQIWFPNQRGGSESILLVWNRMSLRGERAREKWFACGF